ncbi:hypothetical protein BASA82_000294 [Batrachochytrium salamandrivorans]|nr:hypothetical protein BASA82_000294 [Batrachochytrium salamandrivorans]
MLGKQILRERQWVLALLLLANVAVQWSVSSLPYLSAVTKSDCAQVCLGEILPVCASQPGSSIACNECYLNLTNYDLKQATCLGEGEYSILASFAVYLPMVVGGWGMHRRLLEGTDNRRNLILYSCVGLALAMTVQSLAQNFYWLLFSRVLLGGFGSVVVPCGLSMLRDLYVKERELKRAQLVFALGIYFGPALASGGLALAHVLGWRLVSCMVASFGLVAAVSVGLLISDPERKTNTMLVIEPMNWKWHQDAVFGLVLVGSSLRMAGAFTLAAYLPQFFKEKFPEHNVEFGLINSLLVLVCGTASSVVLGPVLHAQLERIVTGKWTLLFVPIGGSLLGLAALLSVLREEDEFYLSMGKLSATLLLVEGWLVPSLTVVQHSKNSNAAITVLLVSSLVGSLGPVFVGQFLLHDKYKQHGEMSLRTVLSDVAVVSLFGTAVFFSLASLKVYREHIHSDGEESEEEEEEVIHHVTRRLLQEDDSNNSSQEHSFGREDDGGEEEEFGI